MIVTLDAGECCKRLMAHSTIGNTRYSLVEECKRLGEGSDRENKAKGYSKYQKCEGKKVKENILLCTK